MYVLYIQSAADTENVYVNLVPEYNEIRVMMPGKTVDEYYATIVEQ